MGRRLGRSSAAAGGCSFLINWLVQGWAVLEIKHKKKVIISNKVVSKREYTYLLFYTFGANKLLYLGMITVRKCCT